MTPRNTRLARLAALLLLATLAACGPGEAPADELVLHVDAIPSGSAVLGRWAYTLHPRIAGRLDVSFVDLRHPEDALDLTLDVAADAPVAMAFVLPDGLRPWTERPPLHVELSLAQGAAAARLAETLPAEAFPEVLGGPVPGPVTMGRREGDVPLPPGAPVVLARWIYFERPPTDGYDLPSTGVLGETGDAFPGLDALPERHRQQARDGEGAFFELRLRFTPDAHD